MLSAIGHVFTAPNLVSETQGHELLKEVARACAATMPPSQLGGNKNDGACAGASDSPLQEVQSYSLFFLPSSFNRSLNTHQFRVRWASEVSQVFPRFVLNVTGGVSVCSFDLLRLQ